MKKLISLFALLVTLVSLTAQTLTVADGNTATDRYIPVYGYYMDVPQRSHVLYPANMLTDMVESHITGLTFYFSTLPSGAWGGTQMVRMGITTSSNLQNGYDSASVTTVWTGTLSSCISGSTMAISLDEPFPYSGGNLLIEFENPVGVTWKDSYFYGATQTAQLSYITYVSYGTLTAYGAPFLPQTTFSYESGCFPPIHTNASNTSVETVLLTWNADPILPASSYTVAYKKTSDTVFTEVTATDTFLTLTGLQISTDYEWKVRSHCDTAGMSDWSTVNTFITLQHPATLPYQCGFEDNAENLEWGFAQNSTNQWHIGEAVARNGETSLYISNDGGESNAYTLTQSSVAWAYRDIQFTPGHSQHQISFDYKGMGQSGQDYVKVFLGPKATPSGSTAPAGATQMGDALNMVNAWRHFSFMVDSSFAGNQRLYFLWVNNASDGTNPPAAIDNLRVEASDCDVPVEMATLSVTDSSAIVSWNAVPGATAGYEVAYHLESDTNYLTITTMDTFCVIPALQSFSEYLWMVRTRCSTTNQSAWSSETMFHTQISIAHVPYHCGFEDAVENNNWQFVNGTDVNKWCIGTAAHTSGEMGMYITNDNGEHNNYSPPSSFSVWAYRDIYIDSTLNDVQLTFDYRNANISANSARVFMGPPSTLPSGNNVPENAVQLGSSLATEYNEWKSAYYMLDSTQRGLQRLYFLFYRSSGYYHYQNQPFAIDNIAIVWPHCLYPIERSVASLDSTTALLTWSTPLTGQPNSYTVAYKQKNETDFNSVTVTDTFVLLTGLEYSTHYVWKVRSNCSASEVGDWSPELSFLSAPIVYPLPYCCSFEDSTDNAQWQFIALDTNTQWYIGQAINNGGTSSLYVSSDNGITTSCYHPDYYSVYTLAYRDLYFHRATEYLISFDVKESLCDHSSLMLIIGRPTIQGSINYNSGIPSENSFIHFFNSQYYQAPDSVWQHYEFIVDSSYYGAERIYFSWDDYGYYTCDPTAAVDNFCVSATDCGRPGSLQNVTVTDTLAELSWQPFDNQTPESYTVAYRKMNDTVLTEVIVTDTSCIIGGLQPLTEYVWKVRANCSASEYSFWSDESDFFTDQLHVGLPYFCDFEDAVENSNWQIVTDWESENNQVYISNAVAHGGQNSLYISNDGGLTNSYISDGGEPYAFREIYFTPGFSKYQIDFDVKGGGSMQGFMQVFLNYDAVSGFLSDAPFWTHHCITVDSTFAGLQQLRIDFRFNTSLNPAGAIDNISIKGISHSIPEQLATTDITAHTARLIWQPDTVEVPQGYLLAYRAETDSAYTETLLSASDTAFQLSNLVASSWYAWKLKAQYAGNVWSDWSSEKAFQTLAQIPYFCDFEDDAENACWTIRNGEDCEIGDYWASFSYDYQNRWYIGTPADASDNTLLYISSDGGVSNTYDFQDNAYVWAYRDIYLEPGYSQYQLSLDFKGVGQEGQDYVKLFLDAPASPIFDIYDATIPFIQIGEDLNLTEQWVHKSFTVDSTHAGVQRLYILWSNNYNSGTNPPAAIDNISITVSTCGVPANLAAQAQDTTTTLSWTPSAGSPLSYTVAYKKLDDSLYVELSVQNTTCVLTGLLPETTYTWKIRANCTDNEQSEWSGDMFFTTTQMLNHLPYVCAFDNTAENSQWKMLNGEDENQWVIGNATGFGDNHALYISNNGGTTNAYTITETASVWAYRDVFFDNGHTEYQLSFDFKGMGHSNTDYMKLFVGSPAIPSGTATPAGATQLGTTLSSVNDWAHYAFTLDSTYAGVQRIYFQWVNNNSIGVQPPAAVDNLTVVGSNCAIPSELALTGMTDQTVTLAWTPISGNPASYTVSVRQAGSTATTEYTTTDTFLTVTGLTPSATYFCKVRTNCSANGRSEWSSDLRVQMPATIPYLCDFENANECNAWQTVNGNYINQWYIGNAVNNGGDYSLYISNDGGVSYAFSQSYSTANFSYVWAYRDIYFDPSDSVYTLSFDFRGVGGTDWRYLSYANVYIGTPTIPNGSTVPDDLTALETGLCGMSAWTTKTYTLNHTYSGLQRLYFFWSNTGYYVANPPAAIDNINIEGTPCTNVPSDLTTQVMDTLAILSWTLANGSADSYTVAYKLQYDTVFTYITVPDEHTTIGNLTPLTTYVWKVRANCTATDHSFWSAQSTFQTPESTARVPYICDFEDATENSQWEFFNGSNTNKWHIGSAVNNGGTNALYVSNDNGTSNAYTVNSSSRVWACRDIYFEPYYSQFLISFDFKGLGENYSNHAYDFAKLFIGPAVSPNTSYGASYSPEGSTQIGTYLYQQNDWTTIQDTLNLVSETGLLRIYFLWENDGSYGDNPPAAIDNFSIIPFGCGKPLNPVTSALSDHSATLSWDGTTNDFEVAYKLSSDSNYITILTNNNYVTLSNLMSDAEYEWKVKTLCSDSSESEWSATVFFTTYLNIAHLPYFCDFENDYENSNWAVVSGNTNQWTIGDAVSNGGSRSLYVTADNGVSNSYTHNSTYSIWTYRDIYFDEGFTEYELEFDYKGIGNSDHYGNVYIGTPAIPHPESTAAPAGATLLTQKLYDKSEWTHYSITLDATHAGAQRLYFLWTVANTGSTAANPPAAIDNVAVTAHNCVKPLNLQTANVTHNSATVSWTHFSGNNFVVAYRVVGSSIYEEAQANQNSLILTDLLSSTTYAWKVKAVCGSSEESAWSAEQTFTTDYSIAQLPYITGFEDDYENSQWRFFYQGSNPTQWTFGSATSHGGSNAFYISTDGGATNTYASGYYNSWAWRDIYIDSATTQIQISFDYKGMGYAHPYGSDYGRLLFGVPTTPYYVNTDGITDLTGELKLIPDWTHYHYVVDVSNITGVRRIYLHWHTENSQGSNPAAFDNLTIVGGDCGLPTNLTVDNVTQNSISFHFTRSSESDVEWQVAIVPEGADITDNQIVTVFDTFYTFTGLNHSSLYKIYVRNVCDEDAFWNYISQYTECGPISELPFVENFDVNTTPANVNLEFPRCWSRIGNNVSIDNTLDVYSLKLGGINQIAVLPEIDSSIAVSDLQISFTMEYFNYTPSRIVVGVMDDPSDTSTFTPIDEVLSSPAQAWTFRRVPLNSYTGSGRYIALKSLNWTYVDDLVLDYIFGCPSPTHISITGVNNNSVSLTWTPTGDETEWQVVVVEQDSDTATAIPQTTISTSYTYSGLLPSTQYVAYVRAVCGEGGFSTWEKTDPFTTVCDPVSEFPIVENFDEFPVPTVYTFELPRPECWTFPELYGENYPGVDFYESYSGTNSLKFIAGAGNSFASYTIHATAVSPMLNADIHQLSVRFMLKSNWLYYPEGMEVGVMSDPYDMNTFESVELIIPQTSDVWYEFLVEFDSTQLSGHGNYIVFRFTSTYNQRFNWIDDIVIDYSSHVIPPAPTDLVATNVTESTADLSWNQESSQVSDWKVEYRKAEESEWLSFYVNDMSCHLSGLEPDKQYVARVAARFKEQLSEYSNECTFVTQGVGISDYALEDKVSVYPNPAHNYLVISSEEGVRICQYALYSTDGKLLHTVLVDNLPMRVPVANLANGIYFLEIVCDEGVLVKKIVKK